MEQCTAHNLRSLSCKTTHCCKKGRQLRLLVRLTAGVVSEGFLAHRQLINLEFFQFPGESASYLEGGESEV